MGISEGDLLREGGSLGRFDFLYHGDGDGDGQGHGKDIGHGLDRSDAVFTEDPCQGEYDGNETGALPGGGQQECAGSIAQTYAEHIDDAYIATQMASHLNQVMQKLTYNQRSAVYLRIMCDMKYSKIAAILNCTEHAARKFVSKGLANLRKHQCELGKWIKN